MAVEHAMNVFVPATALIQTIEAHELLSIVRGPLAMGLLTGKYKRNTAMPAGARLTETPRLAERYLTEAHWQKAERLEAFCAARGRSLLELACSWLRARPPVASVIAGATRPEQIEANVKAGEWTLSAEEMAVVDHLTQA